MPARVSLPFVLGVAALGVLVGPAPANADEERAAVVTLAGSEMSHSASARGKAEDWLIMPAGVLTAGGALSFLTADAGLGEGEIKFTDVVLLGLSARYSLAGKAEIAASTTLLPKQPSFTDELVWQGSQLGARLGFAERYAGWMTVGGGPMLDRAGYWSAVELGVEARKSIDRTIVFQGGLGGSATTLFHHRDTEAAFWFGEIVADGEIIFRAPRGEVAFWLGTQFRFPFAGNPDEASPDPVTSLFLEPQTRVNAQLGFVLSYIDDWDLYGELVVVDRGDIENPATTIPVLAGGFDQTHLIFGISRRFQTKGDQRDPLIFIAR